MDATQPQVSRGDGWQRGISDLLLDGDLGGLEGRVRPILVADLPLENVVGVVALPLADLVVVRDVVANHGRVVVERRLRIDERGQSLVLNHDLLHAVGRRVAIGRDDERDFLILKMHLLVGQNGSHVPGQSRHPMQTQWLQVLGRHHGKNARDLERLFGVDRFDERVGMGAAHEIPMQHAFQLDVVDIVTFAANEAGVFLALASGSDAANRCLALFQRHCFAHHPAPRPDSACPRQIVWP